jgi:hypothetical protein
MKKVILILATLLFTFSCRNNNIEQVNPSGNSASHRVLGRVIDKDGNPLSDVRITLNGTERYSGANGEFVFKNATLDKKLFITADNSGYFTATATEIPDKDGENQVTITMVEKEVVGTLDASIGGSAQTQDGAELELPSNSIVDANGNSYSGEVTVSMKHLDPTDPDFGLLTQGADMEAVDADGNEGALISYGVLKIELEDNSGNELNLNGTNNATIRMPIAADQLATAPETIPLWFFDETNGIWKEEGVATKTGNEYVGTVKHFTDWNCDVFSETQATVKGIITDCDGTPMPNVLVNTGQSIAYTNEAGEFERRVPGDISFIVKPYDSNIQFASGNVTVPAITSGQVYDVGTLVTTNCFNVVTGFVAGCNQDQGIDGYVYDQVNNIFCYLEDGKFSFLSEPSKNYSLTIQDLGFGFKEVDITSNASGDTEVPTITLCQQYTQPGANNFTVDGVTYNVTINNPYDSYFASQYYVDSNSISSSASYLGFYEEWNNSNSYKYADFWSQTVINATGTYQVFASLGHYTNQQSMNLQLDSNETVTMVITRFDDVGGLVEGTFSGVMKEYIYNYDTIDSSGNYPDPQVVQRNVSGNFSCLRYPDYHYNLRSTNRNSDYTKAREKMNALVQRSKHRK